jgi:acyl-CoA synthetase (AMP-forming)/AMP-acid ligase II
LLKILRKEKITGFAGMIPIWTKLFNEKYALKSEDDFPNLRYITNTGGKVPRVIIEKMREFFPKTKIFLMYGLTEAFRSTYLPPEELDRRPDSMGKAIPNVEIMIINENNQECKPGQSGELVHRGALVTKGYWNDSEKTNKIFRKNPILKDQQHLNEIVVYSGDIVKKDEEGFLYFVSRRDELIKCSGYRISPMEVEEGLMEISGIRDAVVFGRIMESGDQNVVAVLETDHMTLEKATVLQECRKLLPSYMVPHEIYFEKVFKKTANDKIDRSFLKEKYLQTEGHDGATRA